MEKPEGNGTLERFSRRKDGNIMSGSWINSIGGLGLDLLAQDKDKVGFFERSNKSFGFRRMQSFLD